MVWHVLDLSCMNRRLGISVYQHLPCRVQGILVSTTLYQVFLNTFIAMCKEFPFDYESVYTLGFSWHLDSYNQWCGLPREISKLG